MSRLSAVAKWILLVCGLLTSTMLYAAFAPQRMLSSTFGEMLEGPLAEIIVRSWGVLIALVGGLLIYAAFRPASRRPALVVAMVSKSVFIGLVLAYGPSYLEAGAALPVVVDSVMVLLFAGLLLAGPTK